MTEIRTPMFICLIALLGFAGKVNACGTVDIWSKKFFTADTINEKLDALKFIHCDPVVNGYKHDAEAKLKLMNVTVDAIALYDSMLLGSDSDAVYVLHLTLKNYVRFKLFEDGEAGFVKGMNSLLSSRLGISEEDFRLALQQVSIDDAIAQSGGMSMDHRAYASLLEAQVRQFLQKE